MNQAEFLDQVSDDLFQNTDTRITKKDLKAILSTQLTIIKNALVGGDEVLFVGFGKFTTADRAERVAHNPKTKEKMVIPAKRAVKFVAGKDLKDAVRGDL